MKTRTRSLIFSTKSAIATLGFSLGAAITVIFNSGQLALAQSTAIQGTDNYQSNEQNSLYGGSGLGNINPLDLIQRATMAPSRSAEEFSSESEQDLSNAAADFKRAREQMLNSKPTSSNQEESTSQ